MPIAVSRSTALVGVCVSLAVLALRGQRLAHAGAASEPEPVAEALEPVAAAPARTILVVHVVGEVRTSGSLPAARRRADRRRGAPRRRRDSATPISAALNLAAPLVDGVQVLVPSRVARLRPRRRRAGALPADGADGARSASRRRRSKSSTRLPGVGPITAQKIVDYRAEHGPFASVDDLDAVPGIGPTRIEQLRELVTP